MESIFSVGAILDEANESNEPVLYIHGKGDYESPVGLVRSLKFFRIFLERPGWDQMSSLHLIKNLVNFPVRHQLPGYLTITKDLQLDRTCVNTLVNPAPHNHSLTPFGDAAILQYTSGEKNPAARVNLMLSLGLMNNDSDNATWVKELCTCIHLQEPKFPGMVYHAALVSPLEIFMMAWKHHFYIPSFVSGSILPEAMGFSEWTEKFSEEITSLRHNVVFEIDTRKFTEFSTFVKPRQTKVEGTDVLLSCYNVYSFGGYRLVKVCSA